MRLIPRSLKRRTILLTLLGLVGVGVSVWVVSGKRITDYIRERRFEMHLEAAIERRKASDHPATRALARGELRRGADVETVIAAYPPERVLRYERVVEVDYSSQGLWLTAVDGRLARAYSGFGCSTIAFFDLTPSESSIYGASRWRLIRNECQAKAALLGVAACDLTPEVLAGDTPALTIVE